MKQKLKYSKTAVIPGLILALLLFTVAHSTSTIPQKEQIDTCILTGVEETSNFEFNQAYDNFNQIYLQDNINPASYFYFAWLLSKMQDYYLTKDNKQISSYLKYTDLLLDKKLKENDKDVDALFYKAAVYGLFAYMEGSQNSWWQSAKYGKKMRNYAKKIIQIQPDNADALYFLGTYDYFADIIPTTQKFVRSLLMIPGGNRTRGLAELKDAVAYGYYTKVEAEETLLYIYVYYEHSCIDAEKIASSLIEKFPDNPAYKLALSYCTYYKQEWAQNAKLLEDLPPHYSYLKKYGHASVVYEIEYWLARIYLHMEKYNESEELLLQIIKEKPTEPRWIYQWSLLSLGQCYDLRGNTTEALTYYTKALQLKNYKNAYSKIQWRLKNKLTLPLSATDY